METPSQIPAQPSKVSGRTKAALWLMIAPSVLLVLTLVFYAFTNWVLVALGPEGGDTPVYVAIVNVILFLVGSVGFLSWLPGLIVGIVLLATRPKQTV